MQLAANATLAVASQHMSAVKPVKSNAHPRWRCALFLHDVDLRGPKRRESCESKKVILVFQ